MLKIKYTVDPIGESSPSRTATFSSIDTFNGLIRVNETIGKDDCNNEYIIRINEYILPPDVPEPTIYYFLIDMTIIPKKSPKTILFSGKFNIESFNEGLFPYNNGIYTSVNNTQFYVNGNERYIYLDLNC